MRICLKLSWSSEPLVLVATSSPMIELPAFPRPSFQLYPFVLRSPTPPPPSQPRGENHASTKSDVMDVPVFPQPVLPLSDNPFYLPAPFVPSPSQPVAAVAPAANSIATEQPHMTSSSK